MTRFAVAGAVCGALLLQAGYAAASSPTPATTASDAAPKADARAYKVLRVGVVRGGSEGAMFLGPQISDGHFRGRLQEALRNEGYFAETGARYEISVDMVDITQPLFGGPTARIRYTVKPVGGGAPIFDDTIYTSESAPIQANIEAFIERIAAVLR